MPRIVSGHVEQKRIVGVLFPRSERIAVGTPYLSKHEALTQGIVSDILTELVAAQEMAP